MSIKTEEIRFSDQKQPEGYQDDLWLKKLGTVTEALVTGLPAPQG